jgi:hypothetical protein
MPPKDDDDPASTKEVVTKKQKQLLNREELDLNLIAESLGGFVIERKKYNETPRGGGGGFGVGTATNRRGRKIEKKYPGGKPPVVTVGGGGSGGKGRSGRGGRPLSVSRGASVGGPAAVGGYGGSSLTPPANAALQPQVDPRAVDKYRIKQNYVDPKVKPVSGSGGDAGAAARQRLLTKSPEVKLPQWMQDFRRGAEAGRARVTSKIPAAAYLVPGVSQLATSATIGATIGQGVGELQRASQERALKKLPTTKTKPGTTISYAPDNNPRMYPGAIKQLTKKQLAALTPQQKYMSQAQYDRSIAGTDLEIKTATTKQSKTETQTQTQAPSTAKNKVDTKDPKDPKTPPVKKGPITIPVVPSTTGPVRGPGGKKTKTGGGRLPGIGLPGYRGKIGRRSNPQ